MVNNKLGIRRKKTGKKKKANTKTEKKREEKNLK